MAGEEVRGGVVLKPCPFCGDKAAPPTLECLELDDNCAAPRPHRVYRIECGGCDARQEAWSETWGDSPLPPEDDNDRKAHAEAITAWNRRAPAAAQDAEGVLRARQYLAIARTHAGHVLVDNPREIPDGADPCTVADLIDSAVAALAGAGEREGA